MKKITMTENQKDIIYHVLMQIKPNMVVDEAIILQYIDVFKQLNPISDAEEEEEVIKELHSRLAVRMDSKLNATTKQHNLRGLYNMNCMDCKSCKYSKMISKVDGNLMVYTFFCGKYGIYGETLKELLQNVREEGEE